MAGTTESFSYGKKKKVFSNAEHFHCSCHATWLPCKTSISEKKKETRTTLVVTWRALELSCVANFPALRAFSAFWPHGTSLPLTPYFVDFFSALTSIFARSEYGESSLSGEARYAGYTWVSTGKFSGKPWETCKLIFHDSERVVIVWLQVFLLIWSAVQVWGPLLVQRTLSQLTSTKCVRRSASGHW